MNISPAGISFIERNEGYSAHVYNDNGHPAIGYGHRLQPGESFPEGVTREEAQALLIKDMSVFEAMLAPLVPADCTQGQWDALVDFMYNVQNQPTAVKELLAHGWQNVPEQLPRWCHEQVDGVWKENAGLLDRRNEEASMFSLDSVPNED